MDAIDKEIWEWTVRWNIHFIQQCIFQEYKRSFEQALFGSDRMKTEHLYLFRRIFFRVSFMFASRINYQPPPKYVSWQPDPMAWKTDAFFNIMEESQSLCFSTIQSNLTYSAEGIKRQSYTDLDNTVLDNLTMVS